MYVWSCILQRDLPWDRFWTSGPNQVTAESNHRRLLIRQRVIRFGCSALCLEHIRTLTVPTEFNFCRQAAGRPGTSNWNQLNAWQESTRQLSHKYVWQRSQDLGIHSICDFLHFLSDPFWSFNPSDTSRPVSMPSMQFRFQLLHSLQEHGHLQLLFFDLYNKKT